MGKNKITVKKKHLGQRKCALIEMMNTRIVLKRAV
jgi:hypothetical protein